MAASQNTIVGIDIGSQTTRVMVCELVPGKPHPVILGVGSAPSRGLHNGYIVNRIEALKSLRHAVREAEKNTNIPINSAYVTFGGVSLAAHSVTTTVAIDHTPHEVLTRDLDKATAACEEILFARLRNIRIIHTIEQQYKLDGQLVLGNPLRLRGNQLTLRCLFITASEHHFEEFLSLFHEARIDVADVIANPIATGTLLLDHTKKMAGTALLDIGAETTSLAVYEQNVLQSLEVFAVGSNDITNDIALGFQVSLTEAESIKRTSESATAPRKFPRAKIDEIVDARLSDIFELTNRHLTTIGRKELLPAGIVVAGAGSLLSDILEKTKSSVRLPVSVPGLSDNLFAKKKLPDVSWATVYGVCSLVNEESSIRFRRPDPWKLFVATMKDRFRKVTKYLIP